MRRAGVAVGMVVVLALLASPARAGTEGCMCVPDGFSLVSPSADEPAPRNAVVQVAFSDAWSAPVRIVLRSGGRSVEARSRDLVVSDTRVVEVAPVELLEVGQRYEVLAVEGGSRTVVGAFRVGRDVETWWHRWARPVTRVRTAACRCGSSWR